LIKYRQNLGQNFLKDARALDRIVSVLEIGSKDVVVEIGPGHGELTRRILAQGPKKLVAIEKDGALIDHFLKEFLKNHANLEVVEGDALKELPKVVEGLGGEPYKLIGNIPYYITGHLLRTLGELEHKPSIITLTIQKEVALRLCATPPKMNLLSASVGIWGNGKIIRYISRKSFKPSPKVDSAILKIVPRKELVDPNYYKFIKALFGSPRKTVLNNLKALNLPKEELEKILFSIVLNPKARPQDLTIKEIKRLFILFTHN